MDKPSVMLLFGGESSEHEVSISSARNVFNAIDTSKFEVKLGYIDTSGAWWLVEEFNETISVESAEQLVPILGSGKFETQATHIEIRPDVILPILHGKNGEDGTVQGLAQLLHIPIVGCGVDASSVCMNKLTTKEVLSSHDIPVVPFVTHLTSSPLPNFNDVSLELGSPLFVKPARSGSSVGVSKVFGEKEFEQAIKLAHQHDDIVLIEKGVTARELEVAVLGNSPHHRVSGVGEIRPGDEFYDYDAKYSSSSASEVDIPAHIDEDLTQKIRQLAGEVYQILGCEGLSRIDFFLDENKQLYVNEVNTMPGFTNISMYPKLWQEQGMSYPELIENLLAAALNNNEYKEK